MNKQNRKGDYFMKAIVSLDGILSFIHSLSLSTNNKKWLAEKLLEEVENENAQKDEHTETMLNKHFGKWKDARSTEQIINDIRNSRSPIRQPLNLD